MNSTETFIDGWDGISSEGYGLGIEGDGYVIDVDWTGGRRLTVDLNPIRL